MSMLDGFPVKNQLADTSEVNRQFDCVPTSIAACLEYLLKKPFDGAVIKDAVYGASYQGGTAASAYVKYCEAQGVKLEPLDGTPDKLVADIRFWLGQKQPLIGTEPDPYANPSLGWTHVVAFNGCDVPPGTLSCLDPYGGHEVTLSDAEWQSRLQFNQVWKLERIEQMSGVPQGWRPDGDVLYSPSSVQGGPEMPITGPFRDYILANPWPPANVAITEGVHVDQLEASNPALGGGWQQLFRFAMLEKPDGGPLAGKVVYAWLGVELEYCRQQIATLQARLKQIEQLAAS